MPATKLEVGELEVKPVNDVELIGPVVEDCCFVDKLVVA